MLDIVIYESCYLGPRGNKCYATAVLVRRVQVVRYTKLSVVLCHLVWGRKATTGTSEHFSLSRTSVPIVLSRSSSSDIASQLVTVRAELTALQGRYDDLHADRNRLAHKLEENMLKYKRFKRWVFTRTLGIPPKGSAAPQPPQAVKMLETPITHKKSRSAAWSTGKRTPTKFVASPRRSPLSPSRRILNTPQKRRALSEGGGGSPSTRRLKRARDENDSVETVEDTSQTQEDSQALTFWYPSTPSQRERNTKRSPPSSCSSMRHHATTAAAPHSPPPTKRPRRDQSQTVPKASVSRYKRARGGGGSPPAINAEFEIDPMANAGVPFAFDEVVRGRQHRHVLDAGECEECRDWYVAVGPLPPRLEAPRWSSSPPPPSSPTLVPSECASSTKSAPGASTKRAVSAHRQAVSRHRAQWERAPTPPGYWEIGFPDTQAVEKINEKAAEIHRQKRAAVEREARDGGGRYRRRVP